MKSDSKLVGPSRRQLLKIGAAAGAALFAPPIVSAVAQTKVKLKVVNSGSTTVQTLQTLVADLGYFNDLNIDVETINVADGAKVLAGLISGDLDACMLAGIAPVLPAIEKGGALKVIAASQLASNKIMFSSRPDIKSVKDLAGKSIAAGSYGSSLQYQVNKILRKNGVDTSKVQWVNIGSGTDVFKAVATGTVDAGPAQLEFIEQAAKLNVHTLPDSAFWEQLTGQADQGSYAGDLALKSKRDAIVRLVAAYCKTYRFICGPNSKEAYLAARRKVIANSDAGGVLIWDWFQKYQPYDLNAAVTKERIDGVQEENLDLGIQKVSLPYEKVVDASIARDAVQLIGGPITIKS